MDNKAIAKVFKFCGQLMELYNENTFRSKNMATASYRIDKLPFSAAESTAEQLSEYPGIGKSTAEKIIKLIQTGSFDDLDKYISKTPKGILDMLSIKGLGPKKVQVIWKDLEIETVGELLYACNENRLVQAKGFGLKTQEEIRKAIEFSNANQGLFLYAKVEKQAMAMRDYLLTNFPEARVDFTGEFRRKCEIISVIELLTSAPPEQLITVLKSNDTNYTVWQTSNDVIILSDQQGLKYEIKHSPIERFGINLFETTGSAAHLEKIKLLDKEILPLSTEVDIYHALGLEYIEPELREGLQEIKWAAEKRLPKLITFADLKGTLHNHSSYSDGVHTLEQMALYCKENLGLEYFGICDHSRTAVYAQGLSVDRVREQWEEIEKLNQKLTPFKIFKGIESDILADGSLDYDDAILSQFDFVVASIHSNFRMDEQKATQRLITAIENPYTTILGHPTGRLLLSRAGYPIDYKKVIDACAINKVVIEINANPLRLDLDWRWHQYALEKGVLLSVNPDAHRTEGLLDMEHGIQVARKGGLSAEKCLNAFSLQQIELFFNKRKTEKQI